jgi:hypothetical protein
VRSIRSNVLSTNQQTSFFFHKPTPQKTPRVNNPEQLTKELSYFPVELLFKKI